MTENAQPATQAAAATDAATTQPAAQPEQAAAATEAEAQNTGKVDISTLPQAVQDEIRNARAEAAKYRTELKGQTEAATTLQNQIAAINKALGLTSEEPDPKALEATLAERDAQLRTLKVENAFTLSASKLGADAELTLAVLSRNGTLGKLNPEDADFSTQLDAAVKAAVDANSKLRAGQVPAASGGQGFTGEQSGRSANPVDLRQAIAKAIS